MYEVTATMMLKGEPLDVVTRERSVIEVIGMIEVNAVLAKQLLDIEYVMTKVEVPVDEKSFYIEVHEKRSGELAMKFSGNVVDGAAQNDDNKPTHEGAIVVSLDDLLNTKFGTSISGYPDQQSKPSGNTNNVVDLFTRQQYKDN